VALNDSQPQGVVMPALGWTLDAREPFCAADASSFNLSWIGFGGRPLLRADLASRDLRTFFAGSQYLALSYFRLRCTNSSRSTAAQ